MRFRNLAISALAAAGFFFSTPSLAQFYVGFSFGESDVSDDVATDLGLIDSGTVDGKDDAFKFFGGYQFGRHFAAEFEYLKLGEATYSGTFGGAPVTGGKVELSGYNLAALGILPLGERFSVFGKVGMFIWEAKASDVTGGVPFSAKDDGSDLSYGIGGSFAFTQNLSARVEWQRFDVDGTDVDYLSAGVVLRF